MLKEISAKEGESVEVGALLGIISESNNESPTKNTSLQKNKEDTALADTEKTNKSKKEDFLKIEKKYKEKVNQLDAVQNERWEFKRRLADDSSLFKRTLTIIEEKQTELEQLKIEW